MPGIWWGKRARVSICGVTLLAHLVKGSENKNGSFCGPWRVSGEADSAMGNNGDTQPRSRDQRSGTAKMRTGSHLMRCFMAAVSRNATADRSYIADSAVVDWQ